jgi:hypothetical protein
VAGVVPSPPPPQPPMASAVPRHAIRAIVRGVFALILMEPLSASIVAYLYQPKLESTRGVA